MRLGAVNDIVGRHRGMEDEKGMAGANSRLRVTGPVPRQVWQELPAKDPTAHDLADPGWLDYIRRVGGYEDASRLYETAEGRRLLLSRWRADAATPAWESRAASLPHGIQDPLWCASPAIPSVHLHSDSPAQGERTGVAVSSGLDAGRTRLLVTAESTGDQAASGRQRSSYPSTVGIRLGKRRSIYGCEQRLAGRHPPGSVMTNRTTNRSAATSMKVSVVSPAPREVWDRLIATDQHSLPSQTRQWLDAICAVTGLRDASRLYETRDGRLLVLPLIRRGALGVSLVEASLPYGWGPGGIVAEGGRLLPDDIRAVFADLMGRRVQRVTVRPGPATASIWEQATPPAVVRRPHMAQTLDLRGGFAEVWQARFKRDTRTRVRRAERSGVVVQCDDTGRLVPVFQELYRTSVARWARREGKPLIRARWRAARQEPNRKLRTVSAAMGDSCRVYVASVDGRPAAAIVVLFGAAGAMYWRGAMDEELAGTSNANYLLHCTAIKDACNAGCSAYHMGDSAPGSGLALFKSRFGAEELHYASYWVERLPLTPVAEAAQAAVARTLHGWRARS